MKIWHGAILFAIVLRACMFITSPDTWKKEAAQETAPVIMNLCDGKFMVPTGSDIRDLEYPGSDEKGYVEPVVTNPTTAGENEYCFTGKQVTIPSLNNMKVQIIQRVDTDKMTRKVYFSNP